MLFIIRSNIVVPNPQKMCCKFFRAVRLFLLGKVKNISPAVRQERLKQGKRKEQTHLKDLHVDVALHFMSLNLSVTP